MVPQVRPNVESTQGAQAATGDGRFRDVEFPVTQSTQGAQANAGHGGIRDVEFPVTQSTQGAQAASRDGIFRDRGNIEKGIGFGRGIGYRECRMARQYIYIYIYIYMRVCV